MWIFTSKGMVSCVKHTRLHNTILVRARSKDHLLEFVGPKLAYRYYHLMNCDYNHRANIPTVDFAGRLMHFANQITYPDFKGSIPKEPAFAPYSSACHDVWHVMNNFKHGHYEHHPENKCDGNHGGEPCADPECWIDDFDPMDAIDRKFGEIFGTEGGNQ